MPKTASLEKVITSSKFPYSMARSVVISFVMLAGYSFLSLFFSYNISPVVASISIAESAAISSAAPFSLSSLKYAPKALVLPNIKDRHKNNAKNFSFIVCKTPLIKFCFLVKYTTYRLYIKIPNLKTTFFIERIKIMSEGAGSRLNKKYIIALQLVMVFACGVWYTNYEAKTSMLPELSEESFFPEKYEEYVSLGLYGGGKVLPADVISPAFSPYVDENGDYIRLNVLVSGAVNSPGYYKLKTNNQISDAVLAASGFSYDADVDAINIYEIIGNAREVYIPAQKEGVKGGIVERYDISNIAFAGD